MNKIGNEKAEKQRIFWGEESKRTQAVDYEKIM